MKEPSISTAAAPSSWPNSERARAGAVLVALLVMGLGARLVLHVLRVVGARTDRVLLGFLVVGALLSMWITDMSVAAVLLPLGVGVLRDARLEPLASNFGRALMISSWQEPSLPSPGGTSPLNCVAGVTRGGDMGTIAENQHELVISCEPIISLPRRRS